MGGAIVAKWKFDGEQLTRNPLVWQVAHDWGELHKEVRLDDGSVGLLSNERPYPSLSIKCAFDKIPHDEQMYLRGLAPKEFWIESDVPGEEWLVRIASFSPSWNMKGPTGEDRRFDLAMDLKSTWPFSKTIATDGPTARNNGAVWAINVDGNYRTWNFTIDIIATSTIENPKITNLTTGRTTQYNGTILDGQTLRTSMLTKSASIGGSDRSGMLNGVFPLEVGVNSLKYEGAAATIKLTWCPCFL
jgi:hypothetical protein